MTGTKLASRYSRSLLLLAIERGELDQVFADMKLISKTCRENKDLSVLLRSPIIKTDKKKAILREIFENKISKTSMAFVEIITGKRREYFLEKIAEEFTSQYKENNKITTAIFTSPIKIDSNAREKIMHFIQNHSKQEVDLIEKLDEKLIGGFILRIGDTQFDASIQRKLNDLKKSFSKNPYVKDF